MYCSFASMGHADIIWSIIIIIIIIIIIVIDSGLLLCIL